MIKRVIEISSSPAYISVKLDQLKIDSSSDAGPVSVPCEDIGFVIFDHPRITITNHALEKLADFGAIVVVCGRDHLPSGIFLSLSNHTEVNTRLHEQIEASRPLKKRIWKQLVVAKICAQADNLHKQEAAKNRLYKLSQQVRSGDPSNVEAQAAKVYWASWLGDGKRFKRNPKGDGLNAMLNYGYAIVRAAIARALVSSGLHPGLGLHHSNRSNAFCLADDFLEPLRPMVDTRVRSLYEDGVDEIDRSCKESLLGVLHETVQCDDLTGPLMVALQRMTASYVRCLSGENRRIVIPVPLSFKARGDR